jgi:two-component system LytT family sensor kinase
MDKSERRICWYSSFLIGLLLSSPKFLALRENGLAAQFWHFNLGELLFQLFYISGFCYLIFYINLRRRNPNLNRQVLNALITVFLMIVCCLIGGAFQRRFFMNIQFKGLFWSGYFTRFFLSTLFTGIIIKIIYLLRKSKQKDKENSQLKTAYLEAELELLKEQLNPHFLFNSLSSLSGIIKEDPEKAQYFIGHLSKIFRYALARPLNHLVSIGEELTMIRSYEQLLKMRFEDAFTLETVIGANYQDFTIPHLTLQPLLENAAKHNLVSLKKPLKVEIYIDDDYLIVKNNLQEIAEPENSTGIGLANLSSRFRILIHREIEIQKTTDNFIVKLPIKK